VNGKAFQGFLKRRMTLQANFSLGARFELELIGCTSRSGHHETAHHAKGKDKSAAVWYTN
jgi:hypothetical protein